MYSVNPNYFFYFMSCHTALLFPTLPFLWSLFVYPDPWSYPVHPYLYLMLPCSCMGFGFSLYLFCIRSLCCTFYVLYFRLLISLTNYLAPVWLIIHDDSSYFGAGFLAPFRCLILLAGINVSSLLPAAHRSTSTRLICIML